MPCCWKQYDTNPEQSKQSGVEPALQYDVPMRSIACSITGLMARGSVVRTFEDEHAERKRMALNADARKGIDLMLSLTLFLPSQETAQRQ